MVQRYITMEEDDDLEALRLAALQTIRPRKDVRRPIASVTAHRQLEKQSFCRHVSNPNLIAIVPTDPRTDLEPCQSSPPRNGIDSNAQETLKLPLKRQLSRKGEETLEEKSQEKVRVRFKKNGSADEGKEDKNKNKTGGVLLSSDKSDGSDKATNLKFDEDELDFEGDTVMLHDDDDSLDRLMDEMEQEFSQGTLSVTDSSSKQNKAIEKKTAQKVACPVSSSDSDVNNSSSSSPVKGKSPSRQQSNTARSHSPNGHNSIKSSSISPPNSRSSPKYSVSSPRKRDFSPSPPPRRRSPSSPRLKRRKSHTPPRRFSRSPVSSRTNSSKYTRARSPYSNRYNGRRTSESPRRRNSSPSPCRRCPNRNAGSPQRRKFSPSPTALKRRSCSPISGRHRRSPRKSPSRTTLQSITEGKQHRWRSPHHRKLGSQHKRDLSTRNSKVSRHPSPSQRILEENKQGKNEKKTVTSKETETEDRNFKQDSSQESLDPKFEARRKKFESSVFVTPANKKICLKSSIENSSKKVDKKKEESEKVTQTYRTDDDSNPQVSSTASKVSRDCQNKKSFAQEIVPGRRVTEMKREASPQLPTTKKKTIILNESGNPLSVRVDISSSQVTSENRLKSKISTQTVIKSFEEKDIVTSPKIEKTRVGIEKEVDEEAKQEEVVKKILKRKKKNKELKRKREVLGNDQEKVEDKHNKDVKREEVSSASSNPLSTLNKPSVDLRTELSRRRAERLKGVTNPMARIIQSAFEDVVANRKKFESRCTVQDKDLGPPTSSGLSFKSKGRRRVHVLEDSSTNATSEYKDKESDVISDEEDGYSDENSSRKFAINSSGQRNSTLRSTSTGNGRSILRRSQV